MNEQKIRLAVRFKDDEEEKKHVGKYVAVASITRNLVIRFKTGEPIADSDPFTVLQNALLFDYKHPLVIKIPKDKRYYVVTKKWIPGSI